MSVYLKLVDLYQKYGYKVRTGLYPAHFHNFKGASGTVLEKASLKIRTGGGIAMGEVYLLEELCEVASPKHVFIIGNAFGWSTFAFALACPEAEVLALDAGVEGHDNMAGIDLTNQIAQEQHFRARCVHGYSPRDVAKTIEGEMSATPDLVFIDGLHTNEQLLLDFDATHAVVPNAVFLYHDIVYCRMQQGYSKIAATLEPTHETNLLWRTYSGIGISVPKSRTSEFAHLINAYTDDPDYIATMRLRWRVLRILNLLGPIGRGMERIAARFDRRLQSFSTKLGRKLD